MSFRCAPHSFAFVRLIIASFIVFAVLSFTPDARAQDAASSSLNKSKSHASHPAHPYLDAGSISNGVYRNPYLGFTCEIPAGWVLRTAEMNAPADVDAEAAPARTEKEKSAGGGRVLLAAFSRPPEAQGEDVNGSILIAAESAAAYPGLKDAAQYFGPVTEITKAQGFEVVNEPYEFPAGIKTLVRGDFQKDVGKRVMRQSTLVMLARGYAVSFTFIGGTEDEVEELVQGLKFGAGGKAAK